MRPDRPSADLQWPPIRRILTDLPAFVENRRGEYFIPTSDLAPTRDEGIQHPGSVRPMVAELNGRASDSDRAPFRASQEPRRCLARFCTRRDLSSRSERAAKSRRRSDASTGRGQGPGCPTRRHIRTCGLQRDRGGDSQRVRHRTLCSFTCAVRSPRRVHSPHGRRNFTPSPFSHCRHHRRLPRRLPTNTATTVTR